MSISITIDRHLRAVTKHIHCLSRPRRLVFIFFAAFVLILVEFVPTLIPRSSPWPTRLTYRFSPFSDGLQIHPSFLSFSSTSHSSIGIIYACHNCHASLRSALPHWISTSAIFHIVIVDWSSSPPLSNFLQSISDPRVHIIHVSEEPIWSPSRAYNLAVSLSPTFYVLLLDTHHRLTPHFPPSNLSSTAFWTSDAACKSPALLISRSQFLSNSGFDERFQTPGGEFSNLHARLQNTSLSKRYLSRRFLDCEPLQMHPKPALADVDSNYNTLLASRLPIWNVTERNIESQISSSYSVIRRGKKSLTLRAYERPLSFSQLVSSEARTVVRNEVLARRLHDAHQVPWDIMVRLAATEREALLTAIVAQGGGVGRVVVVHVMHGLGNRLRAMASALAFARATGRVVVVIWERDVHCGANFNELFQRADFVVADGIGGSWPVAEGVLYDAVWKGWDCYNYMTAEGGVKDVVVRNRVTRSVYFKAAYVMVTYPPSLAGWQAANCELRRIQPIEKVQKIVEDAKPMLQESICMHIRHLAPSIEMHGVDAVAEYGDFESRVVAYWRAASAPKVFVQEARLALGKGYSRVFVAADSGAARKEVFEAMKGTAWGLQEGCGDVRGVACMQSAVAELWALSNCSLVLGSMWSSFSEGAARLGAPLRLAGVDFGLMESTGRYGTDVEQLVARIVEKRRGRRRRRRRRQRGAT